MTKTVVVLGASPDASRYSYKAVRRLRQKGFDVIAIGTRTGQIEDILIQTGRVQAEQVYGVTLYLNPVLQKQYYDYIISLKPGFIFYNPGTENKELQELASKNNIQNRSGCTLIELSMDSF